MLFYVYRRSGKRKKLKVDIIECNFTLIIYKSSQEGNFPILRTSPSILSLLFDSSLPSQFLLNL